MKSRFQLINRGRLDKPCWTVEESGKYIFSDRKKNVAESYLRMLRNLERSNRKTVDSLSESADLGQLDL